MTPTQETADPSQPTPTSTRPWPLWGRVVFRFFFVYLLLQTEPWTWFAPVPGLGWLTGQWYRGVDAAVRWSNAHVFHAFDALVPVNGSGDTSWAWVQLRLYLLIALVACVLWSVLDRRRPDYERLGYWLRTFVRYWIAAAALIYGIIKLFALQMPFPSPSQLATPLGDLLPMRLSWMFVGYSTTYQFFAGFTEFSAGILLLYRRTVTLGLLAAAAAFANVMMINMGYDVPVKLYSTHLFLAAVFLLAWDAKRLFSFLVLNRPAGSTALYEPPFQDLRLRAGATVVKLALVWFILVAPFHSSWGEWTRKTAARPAGPFPVGVWDVRTFVVNGDTIPATASGDGRWKDVIFDNDRSGSAGTTDTLFWQRYGRGYFSFKADTATRTADVWRTSFARDSVGLFRMRYEIPDTGTILLWTEIRGDSVQMELARSDRHFQLAERQFHWLSDYNR